MVAENRQQLIESFIHTSMKMLHRLHPFVRALAEQPDREDIVPDIADSGFRLFHFVKGTGAGLGLHHLAALSEAIEYLLDRVRSGVLPLTLPRIALLTEACNYLERGLALVQEEQSDNRLADAAAKLAAAIRLDASPERNAVIGGRSGSGIPEDARDAFLWETAALVDVVEQECVLWDFISIDSERVTELSHVLNRLKQCFALYDFRDPERICLAMASTLNRFVQGECFQTEYPERVFLRCIDAIRTALAAFPSSNDLMVADAEQILIALQGLMRQPLGELLIEAGLVDTDTIAQALEIQRSDSDGQPRRLGEVLVDMGRVTAEQVGNALRKQHDKRTVAQDAEVVRDAMERTAPDAPLAVAIDGRKLERMHLLLEQLLALGPPDEYLTHLNELREIVLACRLDAFASLASRLHRVVHDLAAENGKRVYFTIEGIETFQETGEAAALAASLRHLLRNSVEHGLEAIEERTHAGKKTIGRLHLLALRQGEEIWISVEDDGRGFDGARVNNILVGRGLATANDLGGLSNRERMTLLFKTPLHSPAGDDAPGLIAVQTTVQGVGGTVHVATRSGKGTCVTLRIPRRP